MIRENARHRRVPAAAVFAQHENIVTLAIDARAKRNCIERPFLADDFVAGRHFACILKRNQPGVAFAIE